MAVLTWRDVERKYAVVGEQIDTFFDNVRINAPKRSNKGALMYRPGQKEFAKTVMDALTNKKILLVEAGVGIGKSYGYLIPVFYTINGIKKVEKVIISTSTIALGEQLISDVRKVCELLNIPLSAEISKGINNYACLRKIDLAIESSKEKDDTRALEFLNKIRTQVVINKKCDKSELPSVPSQIWKRICVNGGCTKCNDALNCAFVEMQKNAGSSNIIITNHTQLANMLKNKSEIIKSANAVVIDEAHKLEEEMRLSYEETLSVNDFISRLDQIRDKLNGAEECDTSYELNELNKVKSRIATTAIEFIKVLRSNANTIYNRTNTGSSDIRSVTRLNINLETVRVHACMEAFIKEVVVLNNIFSEKARKDNLKSNTSRILRIPGLKKDLEYIKKFILVIKDMAKGKDSDNIYWVKYVDDYSINIAYTKKDLSKDTELLFEEGRPAIITSGTLSTNKTYDKVTSALYLDQNCALSTHSPIPSPFDYENNTLFYYNTNITSPKDKNHTAYITDLAIAIKELIEITHGKTLILFTSKSDMQEVYRLVSNMGLGYKLILQGEDASKTKKEFEEDINSCLFATGTFWEGMDLKGKTLSNLIIARLPFPVDDPIVEYKINGLSEKERFKIILDEMLMKLAQGTGRLIRGAKDTGVVCSLDSRIETYLDYITATLPFKKYTNDLNDVVKFANKKVLEPSEKKHTIKKIDNC